MKTSPSEFLEVHSLVTHRGVRISVHLDAATVAELSPRRERLHQSVEPQRKLWTRAVYFVVGRIAIADDLLIFYQRF